MSVAFDEMSAGYYDTEGLSFYRKEIRALYLM